MSARERLWALIAATPELDWLLLTKRIGNAASMTREAWSVFHWPDNVWIGATIANQEEADRDIPKLLQLPARVRFLSCEPLLGPLNITTINMRFVRHNPFRPIPPGETVEGHILPLRDGIGWVIAGYESGPHARIGHPDWVRSLRDQCAAAGVPFLFKQWGEWHPGSEPRRCREACVDLSGRVAEPCTLDNFPAGAESADGWTVMARIGKKAAGNLLDGRKHLEFPW